MKVHFNSGAQIEIELVQGAVSTALEKVYKHLQHVPLRFANWDNPFYLETVSYNELVENLVVAGQRVGVTVDPEQCIPFQQKYLNSLHLIYEKSYNGKPEWLDYHELIHLCEFYNNGSPLKVATIDYRERAGPLIKPFDNECLANLITDISPGTVYVEWSELGKIPYDYWADREPDSITRLCELAKPWVTFKPKLRIATHQINTMTNVKPNFHAWWDQYKLDWCKHWNLDSWSVENMHGVINVGKVNDMDAMVELFKQKQSITKVSLQ